MSLGMERRGASQVQDLRRVHECRGRVVNHLRIQKGAAHAMPCTACGTCIPGRVTCLYAGAEDGWESFCINCGSAESNGFEVAERRVWLARHVCCICEEATQWCLSIGSGPVNSIRYNGWRRCSGRFGRGRPRYWYWPTARTGAPVGARRHGLEGLRSL